MLYRVFCEGSMAKVVFLGCEMLMPKNIKHSFAIFSYCAPLDQPAITRVIGSYLDGTCSDAKVSRYFRR